MQDSNKNIKTKFNKLFKNSFETFGMFFLAIILISFFYDINLLFSINNKIFYIIFFIIWTITDYIKNKNQQK